MTNDISTTNDVLGLYDFPEINLRTIGSNIIPYTRSLKDDNIKCALISSTYEPNKVVWQKMHQCVSYEPTAFSNIPDERACGKSITKNLLGDPHDNKGHWSPFEGAVITFNFIGFSHRVMQQAVRSRVGFSPSVQSFRYTGDFIKTTYQEYLNDEVSKSQMVEKLFYIRPVGVYTSRHGKKMTFSYEDRLTFIYHYYSCIMRYVDMFDKGYPEEMISGLLGMDVRQNFCVTLNARSICSFFDRRSKKDAQLEIQEMCNLMFPLFYQWIPELAEWYYRNRWKKARLNP